MIILHLCIITPHVVYSMCIINQYNNTRRTVVTISAGSVNPLYMDAGCNIQLVSEVNSKVKDRYKLLSWILCTLIILYILGYIETCLDVITGLIIVPVVIESVHGYRVR